MRDKRKSIRTTLQIISGIVGSPSFSLFDLDRDPSDPNLSFVSAFTNPLFVVMSTNIPLCRSAPFWPEYTLPESFPFECGLGRIVHIRRKRPHTHQTKQLQLIA